MRPARGALRPLPQGLLHIVLVPAHEGAARQTSRSDPRRRDSEALCLIHHASSFSICPEFSTRADKHSHHPNLVGITSPNRTVFVPLFTLLILACLDDLHPQNLKSRISNLK